MNDDLEGDNADVAQAGLTLCHECSGYECIGCPGCGGAGWLIHGVRDADQVEETWRVVHAARRGATGRIDSSAWTGRVPPPWYEGIPSEAAFALAWEDRLRPYQERAAALFYLWAPAVPQKSGRDDDWTFWRAVRATIGLLLGRWQTDKHRAREWARWKARDRPERRASMPDTFGLAYWDCSYDGMSWMKLDLHGRCRISVFGDYG